MSSESNERKPITLPNDGADDGEVKLNKFKQSKFSGTVIEARNKSKPFRQRRNKQKKFQIDPVALERHSRGPGLEESGVKTNFFKQKLKRKEIYLQFATEQAARTEILRNEEEGYGPIINLTFLTILELLSSKFKFLVSSKQTKVKAPLNTRKHRSLQMLT